MKTMKRAVLLAVAVAMAVAANAQFVTGIQGGYHYEKQSYSWTTDEQVQTSYLGGVQLGYQVSPKLYVGVMGGFLSHTEDRLWEHDSLTMYHGVYNVKVDNHRIVTDRKGWTVRPVVRYEVFGYGNMHFHLMLQGSITSSGYATVKEEFNTPGINNGEYIEQDPVEDSISRFSWSVSLRPTLTYEFSTHLSAELSLDFLSIGYAQSVEKRDAEYHMVDGERQSAELNTSTFYAGLNSLMETLRWESPMLRLGFNYKF
ncbi:MAG: outer membrane beta-barrel protein [Bacteroidales bacterium]|nr:outer membrane beta-barrel protein [Bacteroidales bacterium]